MPYFLMHCGFSVPRAQREEINPNAKREVQFDYSLTDQCSQSTMPVWFCGSFSYKFGKSVYRIGKNLCPPETQSYLPFEVSSSSSDHGTELRSMSSNSPSVTSKLDLSLGC
ncbi:hypothetical protein AVEN_265834-1 [Araneus ventricosus]|uniref:Uncharacterized protein n=1 Tax=Araneus ventricosus TaxID=182803 RepID=A0A4Y2DYV3_ARAVE|nr:hypothetical protein AVEN_265834-1 [Araneus ventricosus]